MKNQKIKAILMLVALAVGLAVWQFYYSSRILVKDQRPMQAEFLLESMGQEATKVALEADHVFIGSSNKKVRVVSAKLESSQVYLTLEDEGVIYSDSSFFARQRLVYNTKVKIHSLFDSVGTVTRIEYKK